MSTVVITQQQQQQQQQPPTAATGGYRSLLSKPARLWQRSNKTAPLVDEKSSSVQPIDVPKDSNNNSNKRNKNKLSIALRETAKGDIFKLSTINDSGFFLPPSPCEDSKRDHWLDIDQDELAFRLPSPDRLTTHSGDKKQHSFYTPSATF